MISAIAGRGGRPLACAELSAFSAASRSRCSSSTRSSGWNIAAMIPPAWRRWKAGTSRAGAPKASCAISKASSRASRSTGTIGIGHTRWATHGRPTESNAHPHATDRLAVVHNGIIENFRELREELGSKGAKFGSETDTEVVAHLVTAGDEERPLAGRGGGGRAAAAARRVRARLPVRGRGRSPDRRAQGLAARGRLRRRRDVSRLRRHRARAVHRHDLLSRGRRLRRAHAQRASRFATPAGSKVERAVLKSIGLGVPGRQGQSSPLHGEGDLRAARGRRPHARALSRHGGASACGCPPSCRSTSARSSAFRSPPAAPPITPGSSPSTGSSASRACRSRSMSPPSSATARRRCTPGGLAIFVSQSGETADTLATLRYAKEHRQHVLVGGQRADLDHRARERRGDADACRAGDRRRLDQGVHLPARGARLPCDRGRPRARRALGGRREERSCAR